MTASLRPQRLGAGRERGLQPAPAADGSGPSPCIETVVMQPTAFCNIACTYCYLPARDDRGVMTQATVRRVFELVFASGYAAPELTVIWHAGEPLVVGPGFYRAAFAAVEAMRPPGTAVIHSFQTNATLVTEEWCDLFACWGAKVGVSIDGPRALHDAHRVSRSGRGTFDRTMAGIRLLQRREIPFHALAVLSAESLADPVALHDFFRDSGIDQVCFNVEESEGGHVSGLFAEPGLEARFRDFLRLFWQRARTPGGIGFVREIDGMIPRIFRPDGVPAGNVQTEPLAMLNVDRHGGVSTFSPELLGYADARYGRFLLGNVHHDTLEDIHAACLRSPLHADIQAGVRRCEAECGYFSVCGGGAPVNKLFEAGSFEATQTVYCRLTQMVPTDLILGAVDRFGHAPVSPRQPHALGTVP